MMDLKEEKKLREWHEKMLRIRLFEEKADQLFMKGLLPGTIHTSVGQEAVAMGVCEALREDDLIVGHHRCHGLCILRGVEVKRMFAELMGKRTGVCKGKSGSMHILDISKGMLGANGVVGQQMPIAAGVGLAIKMKKSDRVCACFFGDGASNSGAFHEALNFASIWELPVVFVCENNLYALSASFYKTTSVKDIAERAKGYSMPGVIVDGMDPREVYTHVLSAVDRARKNEGPTLIECKTYRFLGHSRADPPYGPYRTKEEWESWKRRDPIKRLEAELNLSKEEVEKIEKMILEEYGDAIEFGLKSPYPGEESALEDIYV